MCISPKLFAALQLKVFVPAVLNERHLKILACYWGKFRTYDVEPFHSLLVNAHKNANEKCTHLY
ncbi:hypothetical protein BJH38_22515 [Salmonella enterica]|nr:hypothetical protein [Salmonella enterica]EBK3002696.1 hypothetical protein [Salmonella enterica]